MLVVAARRRHGSTTSLGQCGRVILLHFNMKKVFVPVNDIRVVIRVIRTDKQVQSLFRGTPVLNM